MSFALQRSLPSAGAAGRDACHYKCAHPFQTKAPQRRHLFVVAGEARSANRTKWTRKDAEQLHGFVTGIAVQGQPIQAAKLLQDADAIHELVRTVKTLGQSAASSRHSLHGG